MRKTKYGYTLLALLVLSGLAGTPTGNTITQKERKVLLTSLKSTRNDFIQMVRSLSNEQLDYYSKRSGSSVRLCSQMLFDIELSMFRQVQESLKQTRPSYHAIRHCSDAQLSESLVSLSLTPSKRTGTVNSKAVEAFLRKRNDHINYVRFTTEDLRDRFLHHPQLGSIDCYQGLIAMATLSRRLVNEISAITQEPDFPR